ncbi:hypothetical protein [Polyangium jinanense]|uniref:Uncharacterized protein n=1 Tax=Polyangium jinanense TaxID=2829994 RepID=A0A9X3XE43_9BACT|nr:hypothetical protein [Polyangium jinanense]MDC3958469.1 hypothetical protein [Polyangium jinanense]MDC3987358.1 hypothetical protein [Polyangium jinanense]
MTFAARRARPARFFAFTLSATLLALGPSGCGGGNENVVLVGGRQVDPAVIDRDPVALLPSNPVMLGYLDAAAMFQSSLGPDVGSIITAVLPLGPESNFVASRDVTRLYGGIYAMQGADFCAVVQGNFDVASIHRAAEARTKVSSGLPLVRSRYADMDLYTAGNVGFVLLTPHTALTGNETGMRRALDRLRTTEIKRDVPPWMIELLNTPNAAFALAGDISGQGTVEAATQKMPFLTGLQKVRTIGNFQPPGMNLAGSLTYADAASAAAGTTNLADLQKLTGFMGLLSSLGLMGPVPQIQVAQRENDVAFTMPVDTSFARFLLGMLGDVAKKATTGQAPSSGWVWPLLTR